jgi:hypothetical protein
MLFHQDIVPSCTEARKNDLRKGVARQEPFISAPGWNTVRVLHCKWDLKSVLMHLSYSTYRSTEVQVDRASPG